MTWIIITQNQTQNGYSARAFLVRRFWRIFPPLVITTLGTLIACLFVFSPAHLEKTAESAIAATFALSNIYFFNEAGYFDVSSTFKPLLHTWSLGVEEQFYLFVALVLWLLGPHKIKSMILVAGAFSLSLYLYVLLANSGSHTVLPVLHQEPLSAIFFLPQYRFFQFAAGGAAAIFLIFAPHPSRVWGIIGIPILIIGLVTAGIESTKLYAPVIVTFGMFNLLIRSDLLDRLSQIKAVSYLARISYQVYLVHWPIIVIYQYFTLDYLSPLGCLACAALSIATGDLLYRVTNPMRVQAT